MHRQHQARVAGRLWPSRHRRALMLVAAGLVLAAMLGSAAALWAQGYRAYVVHTGSMSPSYRPGDLVIDQPSSTSYRPGDVITFRHSDRTTDVVTHRVVGVSARGLTTKGDANATSDAWTIRPGQVQGRTVLSLPRFGYVVVFFKQPAGVASVVTTVAAVLLLWSLFFGAKEGNAEVERRVRESTYGALEPLIISPRT